MTSKPETPHHPGPAELVTDFAGAAHQIALRLWQTSVLGEYRVAVGAREPVFVVSAIDSPEPHGLEGFVRVPFHDVDELPADMDVLWAAARLGAAWLERGTVIVHCLAGNNRSGLLAAMILYSLCRGTGRQLVELIQRANPHALYNAKFRGYIESLP